MSLKTRALAELSLMAKMLELDGANTFRINAYVSATRALADPDVDLEQALKNNALTAIDGIGKGIAEKLKELADTGKIEELDELRAKYPPGVIDMLSIPGFGAKKARKVYDELDVRSLEDLEAACQDGRVAELKGFGAKTAEKIIAGIAQVRKHTGRFRLDTAVDIALPMLAALKTCEAVQRAEAAGSMRRWRETVKDIDFVVATDDPDTVMDFFVELDSVDSITGRGGTKCSVLLDNGMGADLRCVKPEHFPFTLQHFTGSKEHNTRLRGRAKELGLKSSEYGLFPEGKDESLPAESEEDIYRHLGLQFIPPELREDNSEIEAAEKKSLPVLITRADIRGLMHMHTEYSDGRPKVEEYMTWAIDHKVEWMGIADHSQSAGYAGGLKPDRVRRQWAEINKVNKEYADSGVRLLRGIESDILTDGSLDYEDDLLAEFDFIVGSIHSQFTLGEEEQTARMLKALENPYMSIVGHMTGRLLLRRDGYAIDQKAVLKRCGELGVMVEINCNPRRLDLDWRLVRYALDQRCMITLGPDAHALDGLQHIEYGIGIGRKGWLTPERCANCWSVDEFLNFARKRRN